jgi:hypothetical protein
MNFISQAVILLSSLFRIVHASLPQHNTTPDEPRSCIYVCFCTRDGLFHSVNLENHISKIMYQLVLLLTSFLNRHCRMLLGYRKYSIFSTMEAFLMTSVQGIFSCKMSPYSAGNTVTLKLAQTPLQLCSSRYHLMQDVARVSALTFLG